MFTKIFLISVSFLFAGNALAYLDPASGSAILYVVISVASAGLYFFKNIAFSTFNFLSVKLKFRDKTDLNVNKIVFYSEGKQYWYVFQPILKWLSANGHDCVFLTSDKKDPGLTANFPHVCSKYIGTINFAGAYLAQIKADFLGMTTPQLDVLTIKRSKGVKHYAHIVHAPVDIFTYRKFAFDYFDSVFCSGSHQITSIRFMENKRKTHPKKLLEIGCTYYDFMLENVTQLKATTKTRPTILIAPTWKEYSLLHKYGSVFFDSLLKADSFDVILRPHPQIYVSYPEVILAIEEKFKDHPRFTVDRLPSGEGSMHKCDLMISDLSGIIWDYVFLFNKPVLLVETPLNLDGFEATELSIPMWELESIKKIGTMISDADVHRIDEVVSAWLGNTQKIDIVEFRNKSLYNWGTAGEAAGKAILDIVGAK